MRNIIEQQLFGNQGNRGHDNHNSDDNHDNHDHQSNGDDYNGMYM